MRSKFDYPQPKYPPLEPLIGHPATEMQSVDYQNIQNNQDIYKLQTEQQTINNGIKYEQQNHKIEHKREEPFSPLEQNTDEISIVNSKRFGYPFLHPKVISDHNSELHYQKYPEPVRKKQKKLKNKTKPKPKYFYKKPSEWIRKDPLKVCKNIGNHPCYSVRETS